MANTDKVTGARRDIFVGDIKENRPVSENLNNKIAGNVQFILERLVITETFLYPGFFNNETKFDLGAGGIIRVENQSLISHYTLALANSGTSGTTQFNIAVYNAAGAFINNMFSTAPSISGNNATRILIGKEGVDTLTPTNISFNTGGHSINHGTLALGISGVPLEAGYILVPFIVNNAEVAYNLAFNIKLKEQ